MAASGWERLLEGAPWFRGEGKYPILAYSEFMPPSRLGRKPYNGSEVSPLPEGDPFGWIVSEYEERLELQSGMEHAAKTVLEAMEHLAAGRPAHGIARFKLEGNPYWPEELAGRAPALTHERYVVLLPLALSRTQDDKGRIRWTLFGGSEQGPARAFWKSFFKNPREELPEAESLDFLRRLLAAAYDEPHECLADLREAGFRILPSAGEALTELWGDEPLPGWTAPYLLEERDSLRGVKYLLTFRPFERLPATVCNAYLAGELHLLPFPGSLVFWGIRPFVELQQELPLATQIPLLQLFDRHEAIGRLRVMQAGYLHEPSDAHPEPDPRRGLPRNTYLRTHRWARLHRYDDELGVTAKEDKLAHVLFSTSAHDLGLYGKPMARNSQIWTQDFHALLDGPRADRSQLGHAATVLAAGGHFGYRFLFPAMRVGRYEIYWHRPLVAYRNRETGQAQVVPDAPLGYLTAYPADRPDPAQPVELWPRLQQRKTHLAAIRAFPVPHEQPSRQTTMNCRKLFDAWDLSGRKPLSLSFARALLTAPKERSLDEWLASLDELAADRESGRWMAEQVRAILGPAGGSECRPMTYHRTAQRSFEVAYWNTIALLAGGRFVTKDNADCIHDPTTEKDLTHHHRDLEALGDYLLEHYRQLVERSGMAGQVLVGDLPFHWQTDFDFHWSGGWLRNQERKTEERNLLVRIPGRDRSRAIVLADHYDTAYMEDRYEKEKGGDGARIAAAGADDNHSATAALMLGAEVFLELSRAGQLGCDVWLVHLTGEEFPADCLGSRHLAQRLVERTLQLRLADGRWEDLSQVDVRGVYVMDMIAHNSEHCQDVFQIAPGTGRQSLGLAYHAHVANAIWNACRPAWNEEPDRRLAGRGQRSADPAVPPAIAQHPHLHGEVRPPINPRSSLYNTDGQIFSDAGIPVVLFMENYDINRTGYHDTHDTMANIDLDYGAGVAAIAIESVVRAAAAEE